MKSTLKALGITLVTFQAAAYAAQQESPRMMQMQERMQQMQEQMQALRTERDPARRRELMELHRQEMRDGIRMMGRGNMDGMSMEQRMHSMEERMDMMNMMMEQMMEYQHEGTTGSAGDAATDGQE